MASQAQEKLVSFLDQRAFEPVLHANPDRYSERDRRKLDHVKQATEAEIERFHHYESAEDVVTNFKRDLTSSKAKKIHRELRALNLPTIEQCRDEFLKLADDLGVRSG